MCERLAHISMLEFRELPYVPEYFLRLLFMVLSEMFYSCTMLLERLLDPNSSVN